VIDKKFIHSYYVYRKYILVYTHAKFDFLVKKRWTLLRLFRVRRNCSQSCL